MAKTKQPAPQNTPAEQEKEQTSAVVEPGTEATRRIEALGEAVADVRKTHLESHKWFTTIIFSLVAILLAVWGNMSRTDVRESIKDIQGKIDRATSDMEKKFATLAGEALRKPLLELMHEGTALNSQVVDLFHDGPDLVSPYEVSLSTVFLKNTGDRRTEPLSVRGWFAAPLRPGSDKQEWEQTTSFEKEDVSSFDSTRHTTVAPGETLNIHPLVVDWSNPRSSNKRSLQNSSLLRRREAHRSPVPRQSEAEVRMNIRLQSETAAELDALLPAILDKAFKGEL